MKNLAEHSQFDREQARRVAHNLPEQYTDANKRSRWRRLSTGYLYSWRPRSRQAVNRSQEDVNEIRRQWVLAFENGINTMEQVEAGMRRYAVRSVHFCRRQASSSSGCGKGAACWGSPC
jgi:hypothetical protein